MKNLLYLCEEDQIKKLNPEKSANTMLPHFNITKSSVSDDQSFLPLYICAERQVATPQTT